MNVNLLNYWNIVTQIFNKKYNFNMRKNQPVGLCNFNFVDGWHMKGKNIYQAVTAILNVGWIMLHKNLTLKLHSQKNYFFRENIVTSVLSRNVQLRW